MLIEALIAAMCANGEIDREACSKALEAGSKQSGVYQVVDRTEKAAQDKTFRAAASVTGEQPLIILGIAAKTYRDKAITYTIKQNILPIDTITTHIGADRGGTGSLNFQWRF